MMRIVAIFAGRTAPWVLLVVALTLGLTQTRPALATEALGDLDLRVRLLDVTSTGSGHFGDTRGFARIEVVALAAVPVADLRVRILRPDGTPWMEASRPFHPGQPAWSRVSGGEPLEPDSGSLSLPARESARAILRVPLEGAAVHEVIVEILGDGPHGVVRTENMIRAALGVPLPLPDDDGNVATYRLGVRP
ncbi:MAG: hypothetical protein LAO51_17045 [Acidobacteriia bacterium]|nr:hypothetical protein [Terriglobia bacterium]